MKPLPNKEEISILLEEYKICTSRADQHVILIWTLFTAFLSLSAGGLILAGQIYLDTFNKIIKNPTTTDSSILFFTIIITEFLSGAAIFIIRWWNRVANRWSSYVYAWYTRMKQIESLLNMWPNRIIDVLDNMKNKKIKELSEEEVIYFESIKSKVNFSRFSKEGINSLRNLITVFISLIWIGLMTFEVIFTYSFQRIYDPIPLLDAAIIFILFAILLSSFTPFLLRRAKALLPRRKKTK